MALQNELLILRNILRPQVSVLEVIIDELMQYRPQYDELLKCQRIVRGAKLLFEGTKRQLEENANHLLIEEVERYLELAKNVQKSILEIINAQEFDGYHSDADTVLLDSEDEE